MSTRHALVLLILLITTLNAGKTIAQLPDKVDVFKSGEHDYEHYRIPALISTPQGTLLAFCEGRKKTGDAGDIDLLLKRSSDGGKTWSRQQVVWDDGGNTCGNPCPVVDETTGAIWLVMTHNPGQDKEGPIIKKESEGTRTVWVCNSADDGKTWSKPVEITASTKDKSWGWYATGPGVGIQVKNGPHAGRLVIPCDHSYDDPEGEVRDGPYEYGSHVIFSDDHGKTWQLGGTIRPKVNECQVIELDDDNGTMLMNMRSYFGRNRRTSSISYDGGMTWTSPEDMEALVDPVCQASTLRYSWSGRNDKGIILFLNPASAENGKRHSMTLRASFDDGATWPLIRTLHTGPSAYSSLAILKDRNIGCLFEAGEKGPYERIDFIIVDRQWLEGNKK